MHDFSSQINDLVNRLAKVVIDGLINEDIDREEAQEISQFILDEKKKITSIDQIGEFLEKLRQRYYFLFNDFVENYQKQKQFQTQDLAKIEAIKNQLLKISQS